MYDLKTLFCLAMLLNFGRKSRSVKPAGMFSGFFKRIAGGMVSSIRVSKESVPMVLSISCICCLVGPLWRSLNTSAGLVLNIIKILFKGTAFRISFSITYRFINGREFGYKSNFIYSDLIAGELE